MREALAGQFHVAFGWARSLGEVLEGDEWLRVPPGTSNHGWWIYGHLAASADFRAVLTGGDSFVPAAWTEAFTIGSTPRPDGAGYPAISELREFLGEAHQRNRAMLDDLDALALSEPPAVEEVRPHFRTRERFLLFQPLHMAYHMGQLRELAAVLRGGDGGD